MKKESEKLQRAKKCMDSFVIDWNKTTLSDLEKWFTEEKMIWGAFHMAMYFLDFEDYNKLKQYVYDTYGYDFGGCSNDFENKEGD